MEVREKVEGRYVIHQAYEVRGCLTFSEVDGVDEKQ